MHAAVAVVNAVSVAIVVPAKIVVTVPVATATKLANKEN